MVKRSMKMLRGMRYQLLWIQDSVFGWLKPLSTRMLTLGLESGDPESSAEETAMGLLPSQRCCSEPDVNNKMEGQNSLHKLEKEHRQLNHTFKCSISYLFLG